MVTQGVSEQHSRSSALLVLDEVRVMNHPV